LRAIVDEAHRADRLVGIHCTGTPGIANALDAGADMIIHGNFNKPDGSATFVPDLARRIADRDVWLNPTVHIGRTWRFERIAQQRALSEAEADLVKERYKVRCEHIAELSHYGVKIAAGSNCGWSYYAFGGFRHEIESLSSRGLGPAKALRAGTLDSATAMGRGDQVGSLAAGKLADLLIVDGDPLLDVAALGHVAAVFLAGVEVSNA
jgi:imidazolonepropionase-like amidohydrolase